MPVGDGPLGHRAAQVTRKFIYEVEGSRRRLVRGTEPNRNLAGQGVYLPHQRDLSAALGHVLLVDAYSISPNVLVSVVSQYRA